MRTVAASKDLYSIGALAAHLQRPVSRIELVADALGLPPAMRLNSIPHFDAEQCEQIADAIQQHTTTSAPQGSKR